MVAVRCCAAYAGKAHPIGSIGVCLNADENEEAYASKALVYVSRLLVGIEITTTLRSEFTHQFSSVFKHLTSRHAFPHVVAQGYFTDGANML